MTWKIPQLSLALSTSSDIHLYTGSQMSFAQEQAGQVRIAIQAHFWYKSHPVTPTLHTTAQAEKELCLSELRRKSRTCPGSHTCQFPYLASLRILKSGVQLETLGKLISNFCNGQFLQHWNCKLRPQKAGGSQLSRISAKLTSPLSSALAKFLDILPRKHKLERTSVFLLDFV